MQTELYKFEGEDDQVVDIRVGSIDSEGNIARIDAMTGRSVIGRVETGANGEIVVYRQMTHAEHELGRVDANGIVYSHGLFEGGKLGWIENDGVVIRGGYILGEQEVGRVDGPAQHAGAAALLLLFLPEEDEANRRAGQGD